MNNSYIILSALISLFFLIGASLLTAYNSSILILGKFQSKEILKKAHFVFKKLIIKKNLEIFYVLVSITKHLLYLFFCISSFYFLTLIFPTIEIHSKTFIVILAVFVIIIFMFFDFFMRVIARKSPKTVLRYCSFISSLFISLFLIFTFSIILVSKFFFKAKQSDTQHKNIILSKDKVLEMIKDSELSSNLTSFDQNLIASFITFKEKTAREVMIPRIDVFSLDGNLTIQDANKLLLSENYSRVPVYLNNLDNIIGLLMSKDLLLIFSKSKENIGLLDQKISSIVKPVIYSPENKKISSLFQEFKKEKIHLAIVVDEYGSTQGIITIEDILEELVGEIKDEYDISEDNQYYILPNNSIVVDAKMSIIDIEDKLGIKIPHNAEYETIGGYIFHKAGSIPRKGWKIHLDEYDLEILISNERCIEKIKITSNYKK